VLRNQPRPVAFKYGGGYAPVPHHLRKSHDLVTSN
jgi:hypothetical protein